MDISQLADHIENAYERIRDDIYKTRLLYAEALSVQAGCQVYLKLESEQYTGSFKARGALNKVKASSPTDQTFITASTGNHGAGFGRAIDITEQKGIVCLPTSASASKVEKIRKYPVEIMEVGADPLETELFAKAHAKNENAIYVSPYNDYDIIAGQGTIGIELINQLPDIDNVLITIGGGGLICGIGAYLKHHLTSVNIIGCEPHNSMEMTLSLAAGKIVDQDDAAYTLSDGSAGGIEPGAITFPICQDIIDDTIIVSEQEIGEAMKFIYKEHRLIIEGAAAVTVASLLQKKESFKGRKVVLVICGGNIDRDRHSEIVEGTISD